MTWWGIVIVSVLASIFGYALKTFLLPETENKESLIEIECIHDWQDKQIYQTSGIFVSTVVVQKCRKCKEYRKIYI